MNFYTKRTVAEQAERLPEQYKSNYPTTQLDRIEIDGVEIQGYFEYSFLEEKSYVTQPVRADDGTIHDLNSYPTFLTPRLIIKYNMMGIEDYRTLMKLLKSRNVFRVTCYDVVENKRVTHEMYFAPPSMPIIYQQYLMALGIQEYTIELIGTNTQDYYTVKFDYNLPEELIAKWISTYPTYPTYYTEQVEAKSTYDFPQDNEHINRVIGFAAMNEYSFLGWSFDKTGKSAIYPVPNKSKLYITKDTILYAIWEKVQ